MTAQTLAHDFTKMVDLFRRELELCKVRPGEKVAILTEGDSFADRARAFGIAVKDLGAEAIMVEVGAGQETLAPSERMAAIGQNGLGQDAKAMAQLKQADLVIDMMLLLFSKEQIEIQEAGARVLLVVEPLETLDRLFPTEDLRRRVEAGERRLKAARKLRFTNAAGTDVTYELDRRPVLTEYGFTDTPGRWDHWPGGFLATIARDGGVNGKVVLNRGDIIYPLMKQVEQPIHLTIANGYVAAIDGGAEAQAFKAYMDGYDDPRAYAISHIGWGLNERCEWTLDRPGIGMDGRAFYGNVLFSTGPDTELGGVNDTICHLDIPMRDCTLTLDDELIVDAGRIVPDDMRVPGR